MYERWEIREWKSNKVVKKSRSEDNSSSYHVVLVYVLFKNIIMPINKRYQVVRNWKSKATCENMFTTSTSCVISLDVSVKWDYPMHQNKIEEKWKIFIYSLYAWEILFLKWLACKSHFILILFIAQTNVYMQNQLCTQTLSAKQKLSQTSWNIWQKCIACSSESKLGNVI